MMSRWVGSATPSIPWIAAREFRRKLRVVCPNAEHPPVSVNLLTPNGRISVPKVMAFIDFGTTVTKGVFTAREGTLR
jgi:hypothetical protein